MEIDSNKTLQGTDSQPDTIEEADTAFNVFIADVAEEKAEDSNEKTVDEKKTVPKRKRKKKLNKNHKLLKKVLLITGLVVLFFIIVYFGIAYLYYGNRFLPNTIVNGNDYSNKSVDAICFDIDTSIDNYALFIYNKDEIIDTIKGSDVDATSVDTINQIQNVCSKQRKLLWGLYFFGNGDNITIDKVISYNKEKLSEIVSSLNCYDMPYTVKSENAKIVLNNNRYEIKPAVYGDEIDKTKFEEVINNAILALENKIVIEDADCYISPTLTEKDESLIFACTKANNILAKDVKIITFGKGESLDKNVLGSWISFNDKGEIMANYESIDNYINSLSAKFNTYKKDRQFKTGYGNIVTVKNGDYGRQLDTSKLKSQLSAVVTDDKTTSVELSFLRTAMGSVENDIGGTYVEVDLTNQHLFMFVNGKKIIESDIVTGKPDGSHNTPQGTYKLKYKQLNATLRGPGYETPVAYWMPFNGDIGLHDATWQPRFGGDRYINGGSHGCVNLPLSVAKTIYANAVVGMPVICYFNSPQNTGAAPSQGQQTNKTQQTQQSTSVPLNPQTKTQTQTSNTTPAETEPVDDSNVIHDIVIPDA